MHRAADIEPDATIGEFVDNILGVGHRTGEPAELGDDQGVAFAAGGEGFTQSGAVAVRPGESVVDLDLIVRERGMRSVRLRAATEQHIKSVAGSSNRPIDRPAKVLLDNSSITPAEFVPPFNVDILWVTGR